ncbi:hypothetical protein DFH94DRAFT_427931 [Russula ochroleuca]|uniref:Vps72/YL1 C-terminal domain-containing protein n=1 Tax=Russula ochroleuca TaxID=152965 RepID=A0A9P5MX05_9AGAM|nr:hypothetical protein DFH94DRAFT_427931 [Russula ochroleuca]
MPPKGSTRKKASAAPSTEGTATPQIPTLAEQLSILSAPRPFKNSAYTKNASRRTKNLKAVLGQERERERLEREQRRAVREEAMEVDGGAVAGDDMPSYLSIEAPPSVLPQRRYCDITGLEAPYTDPITGLRFHDKSIYELIKSLSASASKDYLAARGVNPIVK